MEADYNKTALKQRWKTLRLWDVHMYDVQARRLLQQVQQPGHKYSGDRPHRQC